MRSSTLTIWIQHYIILFYFIPFLVNAIRDAATALSLTVSLSVLFCSANILPLAIVAFIDHWINKYDSFHKRTKSVAINFDYNLQTFTKMVRGDITRIRRHIIFSIAIESQNMSVLWSFYWWYTTTLGAFISDES